MEFQNQGVNAFFRLRLEALQAGVEITYISFENSASDPRENTRRLVEAIGDARASPIRVVRPASPSQDSAPL
jgi:hypothetical protein